MKKKIQRKITVVHEHPRHVNVSKKNPAGVTIVDEHIRHLEGSYLDKTGIESVFKNHSRKNIVYPTAKKLSKYKNADAYDEIIAVWTDYFNKKFDAKPPIDPDVVKALIASESSFHPDPPGNKTAFGITQITKETLKILQDSRGEAKNFIFNEIRQKDLINPEIAVPLAIRWLHRKNVTAANQLKRNPNHEELILEYKGMLKSTSDLKKKALKNYKEHYDLLKDK